MDIKEFAEILNDTEYGQPQFSKEIIQIAKENGFVIVCGASDDLIEFYGAYEEEAGVFEGGVISFDRDGTSDDGEIHKTQKPQSVLKRLIETFTDEGDVVIDPCAGSFSTGRACKKIGRNFYGFEISKKMCELAKTTVLNTNYAVEKEQIPGQMNIMELLSNER